MSNNNLEKNSQYPHLDRLKGDNEPPPFSSPLNSCGNCGYKVVYRLNQKYRCSQCKDFRYDTRIYKAGRNPKNPWGKVRLCYRCARPQLKSGVIRR
jgi:hypothetical protein